MMAEWSVKVVTGGHPAGDDTGVEVVDESGRVVAWFGDEFEAADRACLAHNCHDELVTACKAFVRAAKDAHEHWDADRDMKVGKLLCAMAGYLDGYRADLTAAHAAIAKAESRS